MSPTSPHTAPGLQVPSSLQDPRHPGHEGYSHAREAVARMEASSGIAAGGHSEQLAAAVAAKAEREGLAVNDMHLRMAGPGQVQMIDRSLPPGMPNRSVVLDATEALRHSVEEHSTDWAQARSPHYARGGAPAERTPEQDAALQQLSGTDRALFDRIRGDVPEHLGDDQVLKAMVAARRDGIETPDQLAGVTLAGDRLFVMGTTPGYRAVADMSQPAPPVESLLQENEAVTRALGQQNTQETQPRQQQEPQNPSVQMG